MPVSVSVSDIPGGESTEGRHEVICLHFLREVVELYHMTELVDIDGGVAGLKATVVYGGRFYLNATQGRGDLRHHQVRHVPALGGVQLTDQEVLRVVWFKFNCIG